MRKVYIRICRNCEQPFETLVPSTCYCPKEDCQDAKINGPSWEREPAPEEDMTLGVISQIMREEGITYTRYTGDRAKYIKRWKIATN